MLMCVVFAVLVVAVERSQGFYMAAGGSSRLPMCTSTSSPCRINVRVASFNDTESESSGHQLCTCSSPHTCSSDWSSKQTHVVSRNVISNVNNITLNMMFCRPVEPTKLCDFTETSLVVKGATQMPQNVEAYNCRCPGRQPLVLAQRVIGEDHLSYDHLMCANHRRYCRRRSRCLTHSSSSTQFHCDCLAGHSCQVDPSDWNDEPSYGYCQQDE